MVATISFCAGMLMVRSHVESALSAARAGLDSAKAGDDAGSASALETADREFGSAREAAESWWMLPARALPVLAPHVEAVRATTSQGQALSSLGTEQAQVLDVRGLSTADGRVDVDRISDLTPRAEEVASALERAGRELQKVDSPWLMPPFADRLDEFEAEIADVAPTARLAADALAQAPTLLGVDEPQTYLALVGNPAESRELGGFIGAVGVLTADRGSISFESLGDMAGLNQALVESGRTIEDELPPSLVNSNPERFVQNWANVADFSTVTDVATQLGPGVIGRDVDGVVYLDPHAIAALLQITGPVSIEGRDAPLRSEEAVDYLLRGQYLTDDFEDDGERKDRLRDAAEAAFDQLTSSTLPDPRRLADALSPLVRTRRLLFSTADEDSHELLKRVGLRPSLDLGAPDQLLLAQQNLRANKLDAYVKRSLTYDLEVDGDGRASGTLTVELTNRAPDGLPAYVTGDGSLERTSDPLPEALHRMSLALYSRLDVAEVAIDGERVGTSTSVIGGLLRTSTRVDVPQGETVTVVYRFDGPLGTTDYALDVVPNATATPDTVTVMVRTPSVTLSLEPMTLDDRLRVERAE